MLAVTWACGTACVVMAVIGGGACVCAQRECEAGSIHLGPTEDSIIVSITAIHTYAHAGPFSAKSDMAALAKSVGATVLSRAPARTPSTSPPANTPKCLPQGRNEKKVQDDNKENEQLDDDEEGEEEEGKVPRVLALVDVEACKSRGMSPQDAVGEGLARAGLPLLSYKWLLDCVGNQRVVAQQLHAIAK